MQKVSLSLAVLCALIFLAGCGGGSSTTTQQPPPPPQAISVTVTPPTSDVGAGQTIPFMATVTGDTTGVTWSVNGTAGGNSTVGTIDDTGHFTAPAVTANSTATVTAASKADATKSASSTVTIIAPGVVAATANVQVAMYTITPPATANVSIQFGPDTNYGLTTWQQASPAGGGAVSIFVAGMRLNTTYHMRAVLAFSDGTTFNDADHTFDVKDIPVANLPVITTTTTAGATPQSGVELLDLVGGGTRRVVAVTDLNGNVIWTYDPGNANETPNPIKLLPNGHFLMNFSGSGNDGTNSILREVDLAGQTIWEMTAQQLNDALATATCAGCNISVIGTHHDFVALPNGHLIVIAAQNIDESGLTGFPNPVTVTGDVIIDLDANHKPVWLWSTFDHLDLNRHPMGFPDWIHTNDVIYSPDDKSLTLSFRHQDWVVKIDYNDGQGSGNILWTLGYQGDFALKNGTDPQDWFYAQHDANIITPKNSGVFQMLLFDNGNQRVLDSGGTICGTTTPCASRVPILQLDETAKTATIEWVDDLAPLFSFFGGSSRLLANGNVEFAECAPFTPGTNPAILEVTKTTPAQTVWQMQVAGQNIYRGFRIPSLYPGVQW